MLTISASVNQAYTIFKDDQKTLEYFLKLKGWIVDEEKYQLSADFLMEMMEINELLEVEGENKYREEINAMVLQNDHDIKTVLMSDADKYGDLEKHRLLEYFYKKKYLNRLLDRLED
jgi:molecular chaperone HscB